jgi:hypothetical protein
MVGFISQQQRSLAAERILKAADANNDRIITEDELAKALGDQPNRKGPTAAELFKQLDQGSKGYITKQDLEDGLARAEQAPMPQGSPAGAGRGGGGGGAASAVTSYDAEDLNQDGRVTMEERAQYAAKVYAARHEAASSPQASVYG